MAKTAFISYASEDETVANTICAYLERNAVSCWIAPRDVRPGAEYASEIIDGIKTSAVFVLVLSEHANTSEFVKREVERAVSKGKPIFPVRVREVAPSKSLELFISSAEWIDAWQPPIEQYLQRLAESIQSAATVYPAGKADPVAVPLPPPDRLNPVERGAAGMPPAAARKPSSPQRALVAAVVALVVLVAVLAALLGRNLFKPAEGTPASVSGSSTPGSTSTSGNGAIGTAPPTASASVVEQPGTPATSSAGISATDPCPRSLGINRELPTPFTCTCSAQSTEEATIWGTDVYTDDSALCRAALHAGVITPRGGSITVNRSSGRPLYVGTMRNGVQSSDFPAFPNSIEFKGTPPAPPGPGFCPRYLGITRELPTPFTCRCSAQATHEGTVWGTDIYTDDSSLCRAALHAGRVMSEGGTVTVVRGDGRALYVGTTRNGVASVDFGSFPSSITFK